MFIIALSLLVAVGFAALLHAAKQASVGYEDETGFHFGEQQKPQSIAAPSSASAPKVMPIEERTIFLNPLPAQQGPAKRKPKKAPKKNRNDQIAALQLELNSGLPGLLAPAAKSPEKV